MSLWTRFFRRKRMMEDLDQDIRDFIERETQDNIERGMLPEEARYAALRKFGNVTRVREETREVWGFVWLEQLWQDILLGLRMLRKAPGFTVVAVLTLALGIGANSAIFSLVSALLLAPPTVYDPNHLVVVSGKNLKWGWSFGPVSSADFADWRAQSHGFEGMCAAAPAQDLDLTLQGAPRQVVGLPVTATFFDVLGVQPALGRVFVPGEDEPGRGQVVILSDELWRQVFGANRSVVGSAVRINGASFTVVGVMPASFNLWNLSTQLWVPLTVPPSREARSLFVLARLKRGTSLEQASAEMATIAARLARQYPGTDKDWSASVLALQSYRYKQMGLQTALGILGAASCFVLLIACANVAGLLLAKAASRRQELAIRAAIGAGRGRLIRQLLAECLLLGALSGAVGLLLTAWSTRVLHSLLSFDQAMRSLPLQLDGNVVVFTLGISMFAVLIFGLVPAFQSSHASPQAALQSGSRTGIARRGARLRRLLVGGEVALAVVLVAFASLLIKAVITEFTAGFGFNDTGIWSIGVTLPPSQYSSPAKQATFLQLAAERVAAVPGVTSAAVVNGLPVAGSNSVPFSIGAARPSQDDKSPRARYYDVSSGYFQTMEIPLLRGRAFTDADGAGSAPVAIVNEALTQRYFSGQDPVGRFITVGEGNFVTLGGVLQQSSGLGGRRMIVGVVGNVKDWIGQPGFDPQVYVPTQQIPYSEAILAFRWRGGGSPSASAIGRAVWSAGSDEVVVGSLDSMGETIDKLGGGGDKLMGKLMGAFAGLALLLAAIGLYGVIAYAVSQRTHEIGIRMALGASRSGVLALVLREVVRVGGGGLVLGLAATIPVPRLLGGMFTGLPSRQTPFLLGVALVLAAVILLAGYLPARRATKVDPMVALRYE